jgi:hypothetical protein
MSPNCGLQRAYYPFPRCYMSMQSHSVMILIILTGEWRKLHSEELHNLYSFPDIIRQVKSR